MRIQIDTSPIGPLRVIREFEVSRLSMLEGLNGIGKSLAVRLLEVCTGTMPYRPEARAWQSLCDGLGEFAITVSGLDGGVELRWVGNSSDWKSATVTDPPAFRQITRNGLEISAAEARSILRVHRLAGDDDYMETIAQTADRHADVAERWASRYLGRENGPLADIEHHIAEVADLVDGWSLERLERTQRAVVEAAANVSRLSDAATKARQRRTNVREARRAEQRLAHLQHDAPVLRDEAAAVDAAIRTLRADRDRTIDEMTAAAAHLAGAASAQRELDNARRTLNNNREKLSAALDSLAVAASRSDIEASPDAVNRAVEELRQRQEELEEARRQLDRGPALIALLRKSETLLVDAGSDGLDGDIYMEEPSTPFEISIGTARSLVSNRRSAVEALPPAPHVEEVSTELSSIQARLIDLAAAAAAADDTVRLRRLVTKNESRVDAALEKFDPSATDRLQQLESRRRGFDEELLMLASRRAVVRQQLGNIESGTTPEQAAAILRELLDQLGLDGDDLAREQASIDERVVEVDEHLVAAQLEDEAARRRQATDHADLRRIATDLKVREPWGWLRAALPKAVIPDPLDSPTQIAAALESIDAILDSVTERTTSFRGTVGAVQATVRNLGQRLRGGEIRAERYVSELEDWLGAQHAAWLNNPRVKSVLFEDADGDITIDVGDAVATWSENGQEQSRPLEAFSSGQQAFAYTRARIGMLDDEPNGPANRLIVLDEFGAFIAHDRLTSLFAYLNSRTQDYPSDSVLVVLPLSRDYSTLADDGTGDHELYERLAVQVKAQSFAVQDLIS